MVDVKLWDLSKRFGETVVLDRVTAEFPDGAFVVLVGRSGCGKSTLLRLIAGLEEPSDGRIEFSGQDVTRLAPRDRDIAMVFQSYALYPHMTVRDNLSFGLRVRGESGKIITDRVAEVAQTLQIDHLLDRVPRDLSGGQRQRVAMGRAIVRRPQLFLFDEPLSNLDPSLRTQVRLDIRRLHDELHGTTIYVTHDQVEAMTLADVLVVLDGGVVQQIGPPLEVYRRPANRFVAGFLGAPAMNLFDATFRVRADRFTLCLDDVHRFPWPATCPLPDLQDGARVTVGVRPHDIQAAQAGEDHMSLVVDLVETLGPNANVHGRIGTTPLTLVIDSDPAPPRGTTLHIRVTHAHLFDALSGTALI